MIETEKNQCYARKAIATMLVTALLVVAALALMINFPPTQSDWLMVLQPVARHPYDPYGSHTPWQVMNPPWVFPLLAPLALLPTNVGHAGLVLFTFIVIAGYTRSPWKTLAIMLSAPGVSCIVNGQVDGLIILGLMLPQTFSLTFLAIKPQDAFLAAIPRLSIRSVAFLVLVVIFSFVIWGFWPAHIGLRTNQSPGFTLVAAPVLLYIGLRKGSDAALCAASIAVAPYYQLHSLLPFSAAFVRETRNKLWWVLLVALSWVYVAATR